MDAISLLHADESLLILVKPSGLLAVPGRTMSDCLAARVQSQFPDALVVHRLDMATSGLIAMGRGAAAQRALSIAFAERRVHKRYIARVAGRLEAPATGWGEIELPLRCDWPNRPRQMVDPELGKASLTRWRVLAHEDDATRVELEPVTGRSHQLRVHLAALGHPILGDELYAPAEALARAPRLLLHAAELALPHPLHGEVMRFASPAPF
ncbi:pseudouridine synthase [Azohydromonas caseinilytica]|uniref:RNA pseudouridine synthase n=1 Tax=Azohydromonas caseinilytica TaxID=2728836 RepID=A0A848F355_9BURK|nr:pseudouridine synthase [Azohydromonas caseinilytica]NML14084.1 RNA pseudouridine synthase [Azohydromonas caseinilytica]